MHLLIPSKIELSYMEVRQMLVVMCISRFASCSETKVCTNFW